MDSSSVESVIISVLETGSEEGSLLFGTGSSSSGFCCGGGGVGGGGTTRNGGTWSSSPFSVGSRSSSFSFTFCKAISKNNSEKEKR